jgi:PAS domain S-box-containing protein
MAIGKGPTGWPGISDGLAVLDLLPVAVYVCDRDGRIIKYNRRAAELWGREPDLTSSDERFCGSHKLFLPDGTYIHHGQSPMAEVLRTGISARGVESIMERPDGRRLICLASIDPLYDAYGKITGAINCLQDISEQYEAALRESEQRARLILDMALDAVITIDASGKITSWSRQAERMFGWASDDVVGRTISDVVIPKGDRQAHIRGLHRFLETGEGPILNRRVETTALHRDGHEFPVELTVAPFKLQLGWTFSAFVRDLSEAKAREATLRETQAELAHVSRMTTMEHLSASIAHEVNQPIAAAVANAHAALRWLGAPRPNLEEAQQALGRIVKDGSRAAAVVGRIHALVKKAPPRRDDLDMNDAILDVIALTSGEVGKRGVTVRTRFADALPRVYGDRVQLQQVVLNLIMNALEAMSSPAEVSPELLITTDQTDANGVSVTVQDTGPGVASESLGRLFESFYTTKANGLGMGLSICHAIIQAHEGRMWVTAGVSRGAIFTFTLPPPPDHRS